MQVSGQLHAPTGLSAVRTEQEAGWAPEPIWTRWRRENFHHWPSRKLNPGRATYPH